jgi:hypothetical protein
MSTKNRIYIHVPFKERDEIEGMDGIWDSKRGFWYIKNDNPNKKICLDKWHQKENRWSDEDIDNFEDTGFIGEDLDFYNSFKTMPSYDRPVQDFLNNCVYFSKMNAIDIKIIRNFVLKRTNYKCLRCDNYNTKECRVYELYDYNFSNETATLKTLVPLCRNCFYNMKVPFTESEGMDEINNVPTDLSEEEFSRIISNIEKRLIIVSLEIEWKYDTSLLTNNGFEFFNDSSRRSP